MFRWEDSSGVGRGGGTWGTCPPQVFKSALFLVAKCPSDNVNNFVEIGNFF
jgi:hypothetical protein